MIYVSALNALPITHATVIPEDYLDMMGHMNVMWYTHLFGCATVGLFKLDPVTGEASRSPVQLGRSAVNTIEILGGLAEGDQVILSDMSAWDQFDRIRLR